jgi:predicted transcriptional regulator
MTQRLERDQQQARTDLLTPLHIILHWLWLYPLSDVEDLQVACQRSRSTVYRLLAELMRIGWVEAVSLPFLPGKPTELYVLTRWGRATLVQTHMTGDAPTVEKDASLLYKSQQSSTRELRRLMLRALTLVRVQHQSRSLFQYAPREQAEQGCPVSVRWHLVRDYEQKVSYRQHSIHMHADAALAWTTTRTRSGRNDATPFTTTVAAEQEIAPGQPLSMTHIPQWYSAFVFVESGLLDEAVIRQRIHRLLCYRESPARWPLYHAFPPLLVIVETAHQAECWQRAIREEARAMQVALPEGGFVVWPWSRQHEREQTEEQSCNVWRLPCYDLATLAPCRLRSLFVPLQKDALPQGVQTHLKQASALMHGTVASRAALEHAYHRQNNQPPRVLYTSRSGTMNIPGRKQGDRQWKPPHRNTFPIAYSLTNVLHARHTTLLTLLCRTPLLSIREIAAFCELEQDSAARYVRELEQMGYLVRWLAPTQAHSKQIATHSMTDVRWYLSDLGLRFMAAMHHVSVQHLSILQTDTASQKSTRLPRTLERLARYPAHLAGVYSLLAAFQKGASQDEQHITIAWWEVGQQCERSYPFHGVRHNLRPDASCEIHFTDTRNKQRRRLRCWLEWDNGTMGRRDLEAKMQSYATYVAAKAWIAEGMRVLPFLLFVVPDTGQEMRIQEMARTVLSGTPLRILSTTAAHVRGYTPFGVIWRRILPVGNRNEQRCALLNSVCKPGSL